jgi:hypothetical protein
MAGIVSPHEVAVPIEAARPLGIAMNLVYHRYKLKAATPFGKWPARPGTGA